MLLFFLIVYSKYLTQKNVNKDFKLIEETFLNPNSFYICNKEKIKNYKVGCIFQIWVKSRLFSEYKNKRILEKPEITHPDFEMYQYNNTKGSLKFLDKEFDFAVLAQGYGDYTKKYFKKEDLNTKKHWLLFKSNNEKGLQNLNKIDFKKLFQNNTTTPGFRKGDIVKEYKKIIKI